MDVRARLHRLRSAGWWKPSSAAYLTRERVVRRASPLPSDEAALRGAAAWLARAQDATGDGGIAGRYRLSSGWSSSYPETTGYSIPTLLLLADALGDAGFRERARRSVEFLLSVQLPSGAFPALEIADNTTEPSPFNSAQIVHGLHCWYRADRDPRVLDAAMRAAHWICAVQDDDGAWRRHFYRGLACTYSAHAACWLAELAGETGDSRCRAAATRNLTWVLSHRDRQSGWFDLCGFSEDDHRARRAHTHTIAYTLAGVLTMAEHLGAPEGCDAVRFAGERLVERLERSRTMPGVLDHRWRPQSAYVCLTGNAQLAALWLRLAAATGDGRFVNAAFKALDEIKRAQSLVSGDEGIRGGVAGSSPIGGGYIPFAFPNWAAKFFVDALCAKRDWLASPTRLAPLTANAPHDGNASIRPPIAVTTNPPRVAVYTTRVSPMFARLARRWRARGFAPSLVVIEVESRSWLRRGIRAVRPRPDDTIAMCRRFGWRFTRVPSVNAPHAVGSVERTAPDVAVNAGAGILRKAILDLPKLGTLGAHMGILPAYRGMNVAEWAVLNGDPVGCSVFWIDEGIDTGPIVVSGPVSIEGCRSIAEMRARVEEAQIDALDETLRAIVERRGSGPSRHQDPVAGRQFFRMHADLRAIVERRLRP